MIAQGQLGGSPVSSGNSLSGAGLVQSFGGGYFCILISGGGVVLMCFECCLHMKQGTDEDEWVTKGGVCDSFGVVLRHIFDGGLWGLDTE